MSNIKDTLQKACSYKSQLCTKLCASSRLVPQVQVMTGQNIKNKYLMYLIPIKTWNQYAITNSYSLKGCRKASQRWVVYAIVKFRIAGRRYHFKIWFFTSTVAYLYCWHWRFTHLTGLLKNHDELVLCIIKSDQNNNIYVICVR